MQDRLIKLSSYNPGFDLCDGRMIIHVTYKPNWRILESYDSDVKIVADDNNLNTYYYYATVEINFNRIFDVIDTTIKFNSEAELKRQLLIEKVNELKIIFETEELETLQTLEFKLKKKKMKKIKVEEVDIVEKETITETEDENNKIIEEQK